MTRRRQDSSSSPLSALTNQRTRAEIRRLLLRWFARHQRDLPWRRSRDPYHIWVSEVMLQQTQVTTVIPYFERFVRTFPALADLAGATEHDVLCAWEGLGYYRRARHLHQAAKQVMREHGGRLPRDPEALAQLPGVGRYMVGAVLSQAFDDRLPIVEANSQRLLCRLFGQRDDPRRGEAQRWLWDTATALLPLRRVGEFNQALMELGALVCTSRTPRCLLCPLQKLCVARRLGLQDQIPVRATAPTITEIQEAAIIVCRGDGVLLVQRPDHTRWAGMWEFPHGALHEGESHEHAAARLLPELTGLQANGVTYAATIRHSITRYRITMACFRAGYQSGTFHSRFYRQGCWVRPAELDHYPVSAPQRRLARSLSSPSGAPDALPRSGS